MLLGLGRMSVCRNQIGKRDILDLTHPGRKTGQENTTRERSKNAVH